MTLRIAVVSSIATLIFACGPSSNGGAPSDDAGAMRDVQIPSTGPIPRELGPIAVAQAICNKVQQCGCTWSTSAPCVDDHVCSASTCVADYTRLYQGADMLAAPAGKVYDPQGARKCIDAVAAGDCLDVDYVNLCTVLWNGTRSIGESCSTTQACQTSDAAPANCSATGTCVATTTAPAMGVPMGGTCSGTCSGSACVILVGTSGGQCQHAEGLVCVGGTCQALRKQGDACSGQFACTDPLTCLGSVCATRLVNGSPCTVSPGGDNSCEVGSGCVASVCAKLKPNGQPCQSSDECLENRCLAGQCIREFASPICGG